MATSADSRLPASPAAPKRKSEETADASNMVAADDSEGAKKLKMRDLQSEDEDEEDRSLSREHSNELIEEDRSLSREHKLESGSPDSAHPYLERVQGVLTRMNPHTGQPLDLSED